uniref:EGF-like domain-containing protein n=1 Tax=Macrostomum lignano TaxID=282301 RepID=A0A1I8IGU4_9PLAT
PSHRRSTRQVVPYDEPGLSRSADVVRRCEAEGLACQNGGHCDTFFPTAGPSGSGAAADLQFGLARLACMCPLGYTGPHCETEGSFRFPEFHGNGYLMFELADYNQASLTVSLEVLPKLQNGVLVYASGKQAFGEQFLALVLRDRRPQFR